MLKIRQHSPELAAAVEEDRITIKEAMQQVKAQIKKAPRPEGQKDLGTNAITKAKQMLSKLAGKLDVDEQSVFWQQVATFAVDQAEQ